MNNQTWVKTVTQNRKKCEKIMAISKDIRYAGVFNEFGRTIAGKIRPGIKPIFSPDTVRQEFFAIASMMRLREKSFSLLKEANDKLLKENLELKKQLEKSEKKSSGSSF